MAKSDLINEIIAENPESNLNPEELDKEYTVPQLEELQGKLRDEKQQQPDSSDGEKDEDEEQEQLSPPKEQEEAVKLYKLKNPKTQYGEGFFSLSGKQEKELPANPSPDLLARIKAGFIVEVK